MTVAVDTHYSSISLHRRCPQAWQYRYLRHLDKPDEQSLARQFGTWWHALIAAEALERGRARGSLLEIPAEIKTPAGPLTPTDHLTPDDVLAAANAWWLRQIDDDARARWSEHLGDAVPRRLEHIFRQWLATYVHEHTDEDPLLVEGQWQRSIKEVPLGGTVDQVLHDRRRDIVVVRDAKAHTVLGTQTALDDMMQSQTQLYAWGVQPLVADVGRVRALSYDRVAAAVTTPVLTAAGNLSKSVSRFDLATYLQWVGDGIEWGTPGEHVASGPRKGAPKFGTYTADPEVIERLSSPVERSRWFQRTRVPVNMNLLRVHLNAALDTVAEQTRTVEQVTRRGYAARNLGTVPCGTCEYAGLCRAEMVGGTGDHDPAEYGLVVLKV